MTRYLVRFEDGAASIVEADRIVSFEERAAQYLADGCVHVLYADGEHVAALCEGYSKTYRVAHDDGRGWRCSCRIQGQCPHVIAVRSVVATTADSPRRSDVVAAAAMARAKYRAGLEARLRERETELRNLRGEVARLRAAVASAPTFAPAL
jgi:uncharacterized Zn finger protein